MKKKDREIPVSELVELVTALTSKGIDLREVSIIYGVGTVTQSISLYFGPDALEDDTIPHAMVSQEIN